MQRHNLQLWHPLIPLFLQEDAGTRQRQQQQDQEQQAEEVAAEAGAALASRRTLEAMGGAERIADALELAAAEAERAKVGSLLAHVHIH
jgi:phosphotransferase system  glucose/maltose/N-acetylglucosamine-specific IIC component